MRPSACAQARRRRSPPGWSFPAPAGSRGRLRSSTRCRRTGDRTRFACRSRAVRPSSLPLPSAGRQRRPPRAAACFRLRRSPFPRFRGPRSPRLHAARRRPLPFFATATLFFPAFLRPAPLCPPRPPRSSPSRRLSKAANPGSVHLAARCRPSSSTDGSIPAKAASTASAKARRLSFACRSAHSSPNTAAATFSVRSLGTRFHRLVGAPPDQPGEVGLEPRDRGLELGFYAPAVTGTERAG